MSFYRIYQYPLRMTGYKHIYFIRDRIALLGKGERKKAPAVHEEKLDNNLSRTRRTVRDLCLCNPFDYFCTFTFNAEKIDRYNFDVCSKRLSELFKNYRNRYAPDFRYLIIPEFHRDGAVHFHGMIRGIRPQDFTVPELIWKRDPVTDQRLLVPNTKKYVDWAYYSKKLGFFSCSSIRSQERCSSYITKYITKDLASLPKGQRCFMASKGLHKPDLVFDEDQIPYQFDPEYSDEFVKMAYLTENQTIAGGWLSPWHGECCADLSDDEMELHIDNELVFTPLVGDQLRISQVPMIL